MIILTSTIRNWCKKWGAYFRKNTVLGLKFFIGISKKDGKVGLLIVFVEK